METKNHGNYSHGLKPGETMDINCIHCQRERDQLLVNAVAFVREVAALTKDGEKLDPDGEPWVMENDDAFDTLHGLIGQARGILGIPDPDDNGMQVIDARHQAQEHNCPESWDYHGMNGGDHGIFSCNAGHILIAPNVSSKHKCSAICATVIPG